MAQSCVILCPQGKILSSSALPYLHKRCSNLSVKILEMMEINQCPLSADTAKIKLNFPTNDVFHSNRY